MLRGGALLYAVFLSVVITIMSSMVIMASYFNNINTDLSILNFNLLTNIRSGITLILSKPDMAPYNQNVVIDLFDDDQSMVNVNRIPWGFFEILNISSQALHLKFNRSLLIGDDFFNEKPNALVLADHDNCLTLCGNTRLVGNCMLPHLGLRKAFIEGTGFCGKEPDTSLISVSNSVLPKINQKLLEYNLALLNLRLSPSDSVVQFSSIRYNDTIENSFNNKTLYVIIEGKEILRDKIVIGNIVILSRCPVIVESSFYSKGAILYGQKIILKNNFESEIQIFASDTIILEGNCKLEYPSVLAVLNESAETNKSPMLNIGEGSEIYGAVILCAKQKKENNKSLIKIGKKSKICGQVYSSNLIEHKGEIIGSVWCDRFILNTSSSIYENHLLDATINVKDLSLFYTGVNLFGDSHKKEMIKWVN